MRTSSLAKALIGTAAVGIAVVPSVLLRAQPGPVRLPLAADGTVSMPAMDVPDTPLMSREGNASRTAYLQRARDDAARGRPDFMDRLFGPYLDAAKRMFPLATRDLTIAGVHVVEYLPVGGVAAANRDKLLINLHGGGFRNCFKQCGPLETMPVAFKTGYRTISIEYRQGPEYKFPAASEDVAAVYREVLKTYKPGRIAIFGCSAGGTLTGESLAWFTTHNLPMPGAAGIACSGGGQMWGGDSRFLAGPVGEDSAPPNAKAPPAPAVGYFSDVDADDPMVSPAKHPDILRKFPPTIIHTGTRAFDLSATVYLHAQLVKQKRQAELHVVEGGRHGFFYDPTIPEADEVTTQLADFFKEHLAAAPR